MKTNSTKKQFLSVLLTAVAALSSVVGSLADELPAMQKNEPTFERIRPAFDSITNKLTQILSRKDVHLEFVTNGYYQIIVEQSSHRSFKVRVPAKDKTMPAREIEVEGPAPDGFSLQVRFRKGNYNESMKRASEPVLAKPSEKADFYTDTVLTEFPEKNMYMVTDIAFGTEADTKIISRIYALLKETIAGAIASGDFDSK